MTLQPKSSADRIDRVGLELNVLVPSNGTIPQPSKLIRPLFSQGPQCAYNGRNQRYAEIIDVMTQLRQYNLLPGIGAACAVALAQAGASICLVQRPPTENAPANHETLNSIRAVGATAEVVYCDLSDLHAVKDLFSKALEMMGGEIHGRFNGGGIQRGAPSVDIPENEWDDVRIYGFGAS